MTDIEKVTTGLELCTNITPDGCLMLCPYKDEQDETYSGFCEHVLKQDALELLKEQQVKKSKEEVLLAIIGKQSYTDLEKFKQLEELNDEYFNGMLDSIRAVEKLFDTH